MLLIEMEKHLWRQWDDKCPYFPRTKRQISPNGRFILSLVNPSLNRQTMFVHDLLHNQVSELCIYYLPSIQSRFHRYVEFQFLDDKTLIFQGFLGSKKIAIAVAELNLCEQKLNFIDVASLDEEAGYMDVFSIMINPMNLMQSCLLHQRRFEERAQTIYELRLNFNSNGFLQFCRQSLLEPHRQNVCIRFPYFDGKKIWGFKKGTEISNTQIDFSKFLSFDLSKNHVETIELKELETDQEYYYKFEKELWGMNMSSNAYCWSQDRFNFAFYSTKETFPENIFLPICYLFSLSPTTREWTKCELKFHSNIDAIHVTRDGGQLIVATTDPIVYGPSIPKEHRSMRCYRIAISRPDSLRHKAFVMCQKMSKKNASISQLFSKYQFRDEFRKIDSFVDIKNFKFK